MFRRNSSHQQNELFGYQELLGEAKREKLKESAEQVFYQLIYRQIPEKEFACLYSAEKSRPNAPVNTLVAALILKHRRGWSYEELFEHIDFDLKTRLVLGLRGLDEPPFVESTIFNFQNRLAAHAAETGENLLERVLDRLTAQQLQALDLKTNIQRADSLLAASNIRDYSRLQLIIEVLQRFCRLLGEDEPLPPSVEPYLQQTSGQYLYRLDPGAAGDELLRLGEIYQPLLSATEADYGQTEAGGLLHRVFTEHFCSPDEKGKLRPTSELSSDCLQSPDDLEATFRTKGSQTSKGQPIPVAETCHPDHQLNLITDVATQTNNTDDAEILEARAEPMTRNPPELAELHVDGAYGSDGSEKALSKEEIALIQPAIRGRTAEVPMQIEADEDGYEVRCPHGQTVRASRTRTRWKAEFDNRMCAGCPLAGKCPAREGKAARRWYLPTSRRPASSVGVAGRPCRPSARGSAPMWKRPSGRCKGR